VFFAVARAQNNALARYFMERGAKPGALFAAAWWGNGGILADMVRHGADINEVVGVTPLHMAVDVVQRGIEGNPERARRRLNCLEEFLRLGADPNIAASDGTTPLHTALKKEYFDAFKDSCGTARIPKCPARTVARCARSPQRSGTSGTSRRYEMDGAAGCGRPA
jgi:ankyrin repeat protein